MSTLHSFIPEVLQLDQRRQRVGQKRIANEKTRHAMEFELIEQLIKNFRRKVTMKSEIQSRYEIEDNLCPPRCIPENLDGLFRF